MPKLPGVVKGLGVTLGTMARTITQGADTVQYPQEKEAPPHPGPRRHRPAGGELHGLHAVRPLLPRLVHLHRGPQGEGAAPPARRQARDGVARSTASTSTTRCACTAASASRSAPSTPCSGARSTSTREPKIADLLHDKDKLGEWMETVPEAPELEVGADKKGKTLVVAQNIAFGVIAAMMVLGGHPGGHVEQRGPRRAVAGPRAGRRRRAVPAPGGRVRGHHPGPRLHRRGDGPVHLRHHAHPRRRSAGSGTSTTRAGRVALLVALVLCGTVVYVLIDAFSDDKLPADPAIQSVQSVSDSIFGPYLIPFWALSFVLLAAMVGRHRAGPEGLSADADQPVPPPRGGAVRHRRLRRHRPQERGARAHVDRAHPQLGQHQPAGLRAAADGERRRPAARSPCSSSPSPPPRSAWAWPSCCSSTATGARSRSTSSPR